MDNFILSIDQGTSSTKTIIFDKNGKVFSSASEELNSYFYNDGYVEQNPEEIYQSVLISVGKCIDNFKQKGGDIHSIKACGISNQRETFVIWDEKGTPLYNAVVWQCKRSIEICKELENSDLGSVIKSKTGLIIDPYFSGTKLIWLYRNMTDVKSAIDHGRAFFGTIDTWLLFKLTNGESYYTDYTNASRTLFFNISTLNWDKDLLASFGLLSLNLPFLKPSSSDFGESTFQGLFSKGIPIAAMIGDSHAATFGETCFSPGTAKATLGTGSSVIMNTGSSLKVSKHGMISTICWSTESRVDYALEGIIVSCGSTIEWLKNELNLFNSSNETEKMALSVEDNNGVYLVPAFSGLGAPYWDMDRKAAITGLTFGSTKGHIVRAALESIAYQLNDVIAAMELDSNLRLSDLMVNGGMTSNQFLLQFLSDLLEKPVTRSEMSNASALGAAYLAGLKMGLFKDIEHLKELNNNRIVTLPSGNYKKTQSFYMGWKQAIG